MAISVELAPSVEAVLRSVYEVYRETGEWPVFQYIESRIDRELGEDLEQVLREMPTGLMAVYLPVRDEMQMILRVAGLIHCPGAEKDIELFIWTLRRSVERARDFTPKPTATEDPSISFAELAAELKDQGHELSNVDAKKLHALLLAEGIHGGMEGSGEDWTMTLSRRVLRPYFAVQTLDDYLAVVAQRENPQPASSTASVEPAALTQGVPIEAEPVAVRLDDREEITLRLNDLNPIVADACRQLFADGHYSHGVLVAVKALVRLTRERSGIGQCDDNTLMGKAFGGDEPPLVVADISNETGRNIQRGTLLLAQGVIARVRNPLTHEDIEPTREEAMEMVSLVSRIATDVESAMTSEAAS